MKIAISIRLGFESILWCLIAARSKDDLEELRG
jgi:hypothetical protein